ncbi:PaREP1 family protein [Pyrobaculum sp.]|uniref:PaREP1 family protein n=1 Tax=Pyrobaculum sp. TaxID=2004705 RepID=UPI003D1468DF
METLVLPSRIVRELKARAEEAGVSIEDYLLERLLADVDPPGKAKAYAEAALELLKTAGEELGTGDFRQVSEKIWGAAALAVKAYAYWRDGVRLASHGELWRYKDKIAAELGDWIRDAWNAANAMHINFYEGWATESDVRKAYEEVKNFVDRIAKRILEHDKSKNQTNSHGA